MVLLYQRLKLEKQKPRGAGLGAACSHKATMNKEIERSDRLLHPNTLDLGRLYVEPTVFFNISFGWHRLIHNHTTTKTPGMILFADLINNEGEDKDQDQKKKNRKCSDHSHSVRIIVVLK
jgi:hypothetical protein